MLNIENSVVIDIETFPNCFTLSMECLFNDTKATWEISHFRDDRRELLQWLQWFAQTQTPMFGFNSVHFDYPVIHYLFHNPQATVEQIYEKAMQIITSNDKFGNTIWEKDRFSPQIDIFKIYHFDNRAKTTSLKALQINMRTSSVVDMPVAVGTILTKWQIDNLLIPYNQHDVSETKQFILFSMDAIKFRLDLVEKFGNDVMNWPDTKIGAKILEQRLGDELCYDRSSGRKMMRQSPRSKIALRDIIFPYIGFNNPEFIRIHEYLKQQILTADEINTFGYDSSPGQIRTKGVFTGLKAHVGGIDFYFGTGGIHGSVSAQRIVATEDWLIRDIDVASLYPSIAIVNRLAPEHLGERFVDEYARLPQERKEWQKKKGKKCVEANSLKLASNGTYGNTNSIYSVFYDPKFTMTITVNGQLLLCMLAEWLMTVPTFRIIQINTDGITYQIHRDYEPQTAEICKKWEAYTLLVLEDVNYTRMFIRDVNNYIAEAADGSLKTKGAYWSPDPLNYAESISTTQPPSWHKDLGNTISIRAAVAAMIYNVPPELFIKTSTNPFDFMCRIKVGRSDNLLYNGQPIQRTTRYYVSTDGAPLIKTAPPVGTDGTYKKANGITDGEYNRIMAETRGQWDARVCTKNKSKYESRETAIQAGYNVTICNNIEDFKFSNINYEWYVSEAKKLII